MRSSSGAYYVGLDHVRAVAAFLVFNWHFQHINRGHIEPLQGTFDLFAFSLFAEGHTGVSLFMVLSGYLFAKIAGKRSINLPNFLRSRFIRLFPLLIAVMILVLLEGIFVLGWGPARLNHFLYSIEHGLIRPTLPNGGWSITVELHFYLIFPLLVMLERRKPGLSLTVLCTAFLCRLLFPHFWPELTVQDVAYWTIFGRVDQFIIGMLLAYYGAPLRKRPVVAAAALLALLLLYRVFDGLGGYYGNTEYPAIWLWLLTAEALFYGVLIAWYDRSFSFRDRGLSGLVAKCGAASYSIYLLHFFFVFRAAEFINGSVIALDNFYLAFAASLLCFALFSVPAWFVYRYYETYWLKYRKVYLKADKPPVVGDG